MKLPVIYHNQPAPVQRIDLLFYHIYTAVTQRKENLIAVMKMQGRHFVHMERTYVVGHKYIFLIQLLYRVIFLFVGFHIHTVSPPLPALQSPRLLPAYTSSARASAVSPCPYRVGHRRTFL